MTSQEQQQQRRTDDNKEKSKHVALKVPTNSYFSPCISDLSRYFSALICAPFCLSLTGNFVHVSFCISYITNLFSSIL
jgi:hypothetical protein